MSRAPVSLPQLSPGAQRTCAPQKPRRSKAGKWRAAVLIGLHVVLALHIAHWLNRGKTLTPLEPSEAIYTFTQGYVNAGAILLALAILSTLVLGRFFCGWACHVVALQDASTWLLGKLRIRPKPLRSRLLIFVPLGAAIYMFIWPIFMRHVVAEQWFDVPVPAYEAHFATEKFWDTFPGWGGALVTFAVCGGLIVYFLGNKGFCAYACPYGGFFGVADRFSPGRIRVTDDCEQCGHCTSVCTSNVRVHEEVNRYGMVVDPGCMKCLDCISVCPKDALYFGFGGASAKRAAAAREKRGIVRGVRPPKQFDFTWAEELLMAGVFFVTLFIVRGLYDFVPFLLSLAIAGINAFLVVQLLRTFREKNVRLQRVQLRFAGHTTRGGWIFRGAMALWLLFLAHSGWMQWLRSHGTGLIDEGRKQYNAMNGMTPVAEASLREGLAELSRARRWGLTSFADLEQQLGSAHFYLHDLPKAEEHFRAAVKYQPKKFVSARYQLATLAMLRDDAAEAERQLRAIIAHSPEHEDAAERLGALLSQRKDLVAVEELYQELARRRPREGRFHLLLAQFYGAQQRMSEYEQTLVRGREQAPTNAQIALQLAGLRVFQQKPDEALQIVEDIVHFAPDFEPAWQAGVQLATAAGDPARAAEYEKRLKTVVEARSWMQRVGSSASAPSESAFKQFARGAFGLPEATPLVLAVQSLESRAARSTEDELRLLMLYRAGHYESRIAGAVRRVSKSLGLLK